MTNIVKPIPEGYHSITPYFIVKNGEEAIEFYKKAFGAEEIMRMESPDGKIAHAELTIGDSKIMLADECPEMGVHSKTAGSCLINIHLYVENVDATTNQAIAAGAKLDHPVSDQFYGDRSGSVKDPFGISWYIATHIEDLSSEEIEKRAEEFMKQKKAS